MFALQLVALALCAIATVVFLRRVLKEWSGQKRPAEKKIEKSLQRIKQIDALVVPKPVLQRVRELLREKGVALDAQMEGYMVQGFKDYLIAVRFARSSDPSGRHPLVMTSDTVDMLWHAWLEDEAYEETFTSLLGFPLTHVPDAPEQVAMQRGPGRIDFLEGDPRGRAAATYCLLRAALPVVGRKVQNSGLYLLDGMAKNPDGFYYTGAIFTALEREAVRTSVLRSKAAVAANYVAGCGSSFACVTAVGDHGGHGGHGGGHGCGSSCGSGGH